MDAKTKEFLIKLQTLLKEYDASVCWGCGRYSDMNGIYEEYMAVNVDEGGGIKETQTTVNQYGSYITHQHIDELLSEEETMEIDETEGLAE